MYEFSRAGAQGFPQNGLAANMKPQNQQLSFSRVISRLGLSEELRSSCSDCATWDGELNEIHWRENPAVFFSSYANNLRSETLSFAPQTTIFHHR
jgi:hypothetical protein